MASLKDRLPPPKSTVTRFCDHSNDPWFKNTDKFKPDRAFTGASERSRKRERPVEFDKEDEQDPFGLDRFVSDVNKSKKKKALDKIGSGGTIRASGGGGSSSRDDYGGTKINFERGDR